MKRSFSAVGLSPACTWDGQISAIGVVTDALNMNPFSYGAWRMGNDVYTCAHNACEHAHHCKTQTRTHTHTHTHTQRETTRKHKNANVLANRECRKAMVPPIIRMQEDRRQPLREGGFMDVLLR